MKHATTIMALAIAVLPRLAFAQTTPPPIAPTPSEKAGARIDQRQANQQKRINEGVKSGELTEREAAHLQKNQAHIQKMEDKARADGKITKNEAARIERAQERQSKTIYREKHDNQKVVK